MIKQKIFDGSICSGFWFFDGVVVQIILNFPKKYTRSRYSANKLGSTVHKIIQPNRTGLS